jgi:DNA-binding HxlR family transcriptional regulator
MERTSFADRECPVARTLEIVGDWWSLLILRDALRGLRRFEDLRSSLGVARNILSRRLKRLVAAGVLEKHVYAERPRRHEYRLTDRGRDLFPLIALMTAWGNRWAPLKRGPAVLMIDRETGTAVEPILVDRATRREITRRGVALAQGPGAGAETRAAFARAAELAAMPPPERLTSAMPLRRKRP